MKIAIMGAGGEGGYLGGRLAQAGRDVAFIARGEHLAALRRRGLQVHSPLGDFAIQPLLATDQPAEVGRVDVGGQPLLEAVMLVVTDEVHPTGQNGPISRVRQAMSESRYVGVKDVRVVPHPQIAGIPRGHKTHARRHTQRRGAVGVQKTDRSLRQTVQIRRSHNAMSGAAHHARMVLIRHNEQYVRLQRHSDFPPALPQDPNTVFSAA